MNKFLDWFLLMVVFSKAMTSVAIAVNGVRGGKGGGGSRRAVRWAVENLLPTADRFILVHVMPKITSIPTPSIFFSLKLFVWLLGNTGKINLDNNFLIFLLYSGGSCGCLRTWCRCGSSLCSWCETEIWTSFCPF